jgi:hypothetical protein
MTIPDFTAGRENGRQRPRGYADWRPQAKTRALLEQVQEIFATYEDYLPLTVRQVYYALVGTYDYPKTDNAYERLCEHLVRARRARMIPFDWLRDDGVVVMQHRWFDGVADFWDHVGQQARDFEHDKQIGQPVYVELWTEAAGMMPQLARVAEQFSVPVYSCGGFASLPAVRQIVDRAYSRNVPTVLLHVGDFDTSGEAVFEHIVQDAGEFLAEDRVLQTQEIIARRVALTSRQVELNDLPTSPAKLTDSRSAKWKGGTCQVEALPPNVLAMYVKRAIEYFLDDDLLARHDFAEQEERVQLLRALPSGEAGA